MTRHSRWIMLVLFASASMGANAQLHSAVSCTTLQEGWQFRALADKEHKGVDEWHKATLPGEVHTDLQAAGLIPNLFEGDNEKRLQWIGEEDWEYRTSLNANTKLLQHAHVELAFQGLDTFADVTLNGQTILKADNMFRTWRVDVRSLLHEGENELRVVFHSPYKVMTPVVSKLPYILPGSGYEASDAAKGIYPVGHYIRTAGYEYGWDWGPKFVTMGLWRPVSLEAWDDFRITQLHVEQRSVTAERALLTAMIDVEAAQAGTARISVHIDGIKGRTGDGVQYSGEEKLDAGVNHLVIPLRIENPHRWFPAGYGVQDRYHVVANVTAHATDRAEENIGLRSVELRREPDAWGTSFTFVVNGIPIFAKGANVIPMDSFPGRVTVERERDLLTAARDANMNMIRMWGGGYYQTDSFYSIADELGLMVWQEFAFGGGLVPGDKAFQENVRAEALEQVRRLRDHASVVIWCGNNEVETSWDAWGDRLDFKKSLTPDQRERVWQDYVVMFRDILKSAVAEQGGGVPYLSSSPSANFEERANNDHNGDMHFWDVWSGKAPISKYSTVQTRFLSEYGFQGMPDLNTVRSFAGNEENVDAPALASHERFTRGFDRLKFYMDQEIGTPKDFASLVYLSQYMQAEAIRLAAEHLRSSKPRTMGSLYWQLNDCWPSVSWASIDYYGRPKALQYYARRFYAPLLIAQEYTEDKIQTHLVSDQTEAADGQIHVRVMDFAGHVLHESAQVVHLPALSSIALDLIDTKKIDGFDAAKDVAVFTWSVNGKELSRNTLFFASAKMLQLPEPKLEAKLASAGDGQYVVHLHSDAVAKAVQISFAGIDAKLADNFIDLLPGETVDVKLRSKTSLDQLRSKLQLATVATAIRKE